MIIDVHTHFITGALRDAFLARGEPPFMEIGEDGRDVFHMPVGKLALNDAYYDMDARLDYMAGEGVARQILSFPGLFGLDSLPAEVCGPLLTGFNDDLAGLCRAHPDHFSGLAALPIADMDDSVAEYRRARTELGLIGAILPNNGFIGLAQAQRFKPLLDAAEELGGHLFIHPGRRPDEVPAPGAQPKGPAFDDSFIMRQALAVQHAVAHCMTTLLFTDFLDGYGNFTLHVANLGGTLPMVIERMDQVVLTRTPDEPMPSSLAGRVYVDCSSLGARSIEIAAAVFGADKILFGTDCPIFRTDWSKTAVAGADIGEDAREQIRHGNAERLLTGLI